MANIGNVMTNAAQINAGTTVLINLGAASDGRNTKRIPVNESVTLAELGVDANAAAAAKPEFPTARIAEVSASALSDEEKMRRIGAVTDEFRKLSEAFAATKGQTLSDRIRTAVINRLVGIHGYSRTNAAGAPFVSEDSIQVLAVQVNGAYLFNVTGTATWGV